MFDDGPLRLSEDAQDNSTELDSETASLLRSFMVPAIDAARDWAELNASLKRKGFALGFRDGRLMFKRIEDGKEICTGRFLGTPLRDLVQKLGRPCVRADANGHTGTLLT